MGALGEIRQDVPLEGAWKGLDRTCLAPHSIPKALGKFFSVFGIPKIIQTDQGTNFAQVLKELGVQHATSSPYHRESQGALERFHQTLKSMMRKHCHASNRDWDESLQFLMFAAREAVQESLGFSPAELVFGRDV